MLLFLRHLWACKRYFVFFFCGSVFGGNFGCTCQALSPPQKTQGRHRPGVRFSPRISQRHFWMQPKTTITCCSGFLYSYLAGIGWITVHLVASPSCIRACVRLGDDKVRCPHTCSGLLCCGSDCDVLEPSHIEKKKAPGKHNTARLDLAQRFCYMFIQCFACCPRSESQHKRNHFCRIPL